MNHPGAQFDRPTSEIAAKARAAMSATGEAEADCLSDGNGFFKPVSPRLSVLHLAVQIEPDPAEAGFWYCRTRIAELGGLTAAQLVSLGRADEVIGFLLSVRDGTRD